MKPEATNRLRAMLLMCVEVMKEIPKHQKPFALDGLRLIAGGIADVLKAQQVPDITEDMIKKHWIKMVVSQTKFEQKTHLETLAALRSL